MGIDSLGSENSDHLMTDGPRREMELPKKKNSVNSNDMV